MIRFWESDPAGARPDSNPSTPSLFVHGYNGDLCDFAPLLVRVAKDRRVIAFDLPNFGGSVGDEDDSSIHAYVGLIGDLVRRMRLDRVHLVCHSMGAQVCIGAGLGSPSYMASLTLIDAAGVYESATFLGDLSKRNQNLNWGTMLAVKGRTALDILDGNQTFFRRFAFENPAVWVAISSFQSSFRSQVHKLALPVLILWGQKDPIFTLDSASLLKENIANSILYVIEDAGHSPQQSHPEKTATLIENFHSQVESSQHPSNPGSPTQEATKPCAPPSLP